MHKEEMRRYLVLLKDNHLERTGFSSLAEAMDFIIKKGNPQKYILATEDYTRISDSNFGFISEKTQICRVTFTIYEVWKSDEIGHEFHEASFWDVSNVYDYINTMDRYYPGWHFFCREVKF